MKYHLRLTAAQHEAIRKHLYPGDGLEATALILCGRRCLQLPSGFLPVFQDLEGRAGLVVEPCALPLEPGLRLWPSATACRPIRTQTGFAELDRMGKLWIPEEQYIESRLGRSVVLLGNFDLIELWDPEIYRTAMEDLEERIWGGSRMWPSPDDDHR